MRVRIVLPLAAAAALVLPVAARGDSSHIVAPGESLTSIAAADGISVPALAAANRLSPNARLIAGSVLRIPPRGRGGTTRPVTPRPRRYVVRRGDTLSAIAARAGVSLTTLAALNHIHHPALLVAGTVLTLPGSGSATTTTRPHPTTHHYVVRRGDTLSAIAARAGVSLTTLAALNHIHHPALLVAGTVLTLPGSGSATTTTRPHPTTHHYVVRRGDTLSAIAARAGVSLTTLAALNHIHHPALLVAGTVLTLPGSGSATTTTRPHPTTHHYVVRRGDTLSAIAARAGVSLTTLAALNHIHHPALLVAGTVLTLPGSGSATTTTRPHPTTHHYVVRRGDTLSAIAARAGVSLTTLAALNHIHHPALLVAGTVLTLPGSGSATTTTRPHPTTHHYVVRRGDTLSAIAARAGVSLTTLAALNHIHHPALLVAGTVLTVPGGGAAPTSTRLSTAQRYLVQPGDTLSGIAARAGVGLTALAAFNGLSTNGVLFAGATLTLPAGSLPVGPPLPADAPPYPTPERVTASQVEQIAAANGVPASLAAAIGWQESGFNNDLVSSADARGVMQILPTTWSWIERALDAGTPLEPASAIDNVRGGVLLLRSLLIATGGDARLATAGYIQGLQSVRAHGMFAATRRYVADVMALRQMFGGS